MQRALHTRFWIEAAIACGGFAAFLLTALWHDWIEVVFRVDPDQHSGAAEWLVLAFALGIAVSCSVLARIEWRKAAAAPLG